MEFEAVDEGTIAKILVPEGTDEVKVGTVIALIAGEGEDAERCRGPRPRRIAVPVPPKAEAPKPDAPPAPAPAPAPAAKASGGERVKASPLARRLAGQQGIDLAGADRLRSRRPNREGGPRRRGGQGHG